MRVVQINAVYEYSSTGRTTKEIHLELKRRGYQSYVFCTNYEDPFCNVYSMGTKISRGFHGLMSRLTGLQGYYSLGATIKLLRKLDEIKPDVICLRNLHGNYIHVNMLLDYLNKYQIPTVVVLHDCWLFTGHCCHFLEDNCYKWQENCGKCPAKHKWNKSWIFDWSKRVLNDRRKRFTKLNNLTVIGVSDWITDQCKKSFMKTNAQFTRIYNWVDLDTFFPIEKKINRRPRILSVAQVWSKVKGLSDIISVARENPFFDFVMVGKLPDDIELPANIVALGILNDIYKLREQYQNADVLLHLSYQETFGKVIAEALACGTPAIVYDITAMPELIGDGCGKVVHKGDWKSASKALGEVLQTPNNPMNISGFVERNFSKKFLIEQTIDVFLQMDLKER